MSYDDIKSPPVCQFKAQSPSVDPSEVHIVMWESRLGPLPTSSSLNPSGKHLLTNGVSAVRQPLTNSAPTVAPLLTNGALTVKRPITLNVSSQKPPVRPVSCAMSLLSASSSPANNTLTTATCYPSASANKIQLTTGQPLMATSAHCLGLSSSGSTTPVERLLRAREKFRQEQNGLRMPSFVRPVIPTNAVHKLSLTSAADTEQDLLAKNKAAVGRKRKTVPSHPAAGAGAAVSADKTTTVHSVSTRQLKIGPSTYSAILDRLHKRTTTCQPAIPATSMFGAYVPKSKLVPINVSTSQITTSKPSDVTTTTSRDRQHKVCFALPAESKLPNGLLQGDGKLRNGTLPVDGKLPSGSLQGDSKLRNGTLPVDGKLPSGSLQGDGKLHNGTAVDSKLPYNASSTNGLPTSDSLTSTDSTVGTDCASCHSAVVGVSSDSLLTLDSDSQHLPSDDSLVFPEDISWLCDELFSTDSVPVQDNFLAALDTGSNTVPASAFGLTFDDDLNVFDNIFF